MLAHPEVGEFWYEVQYDAVAADSAKAHSISAPLGSTTKTTVPFANPLDSRAVFALRSSDPSKVVLASKQLTLAAGEVADVAVHYTPSSLGVDERCVITLESQVCSNLLGAS